MKIVVYGIGGVGGYFGGKLIQAGYDVTFIARGAHLKAIKEKGIQVKSIQGDFIAKPSLVTDDVSEVSNPDLILLGVKSWQVIDVAQQIKPIITEKTLVLPLQNGADNADKLLTVLESGNVLAGLCKIVSKVEAPGIINHFAYEPEIIYGELDNAKTERVKAVKRAFDHAGFKSTISDDIHLDIWKKFLFIATVSGIGALTRSVFGVMRKDAHVRQMMIDTANEIREVANAKGIDLTTEDVEKTFKIIDALDENTTAFMQRDIMEGKPSELENFNGYIVAMGKQFNIPTPVNAFTYYSLIPQERKARNE
ncbi:2-dehydropantoate 2-reductase [Flavobacteriaceae bacterium R38]|nr:2-dehydropantoate 2-reductase [Flavobacteriaceae bacterium R38]